MSVDKTLFDIGQDMKALDRLLDEAQGDITGQEEIIDAWLEENASNMGEKIDGYGFYLDELYARADAIKEKRKQLREREKALENRADRLKDHLQWFMENFGHSEIQGQTRTAKLQKAGGHPPVEIDESYEKHPEALPNPYKRVKTEPDTTAIREALQEGRDLGFARLGERSQYVRFY